MGRRPRARRPRRARTAPGSNYLVQHSAGSGKSNTIAWLAHRLANLHDADDAHGLRQGRRHHRPRRARPAAAGHDLPVRPHARRRRSRSTRTPRSSPSALQPAAARRSSSRRCRSSRSSSRQRRRAAGRPLRGHRRRGALVARPARRRRTLKTGARRRAPTEQLDGRRGQEAERGSRRRRGPADSPRRGPRPARPTCRSSPSPRPRRHKTLELFGTPRRRRRRTAPFHLYSMRQAIEEGFILDVLANYTTYETY